MEEKSLKEQQFEALSVLVTYNKKLTSGIHGVIAELTGNRQADTDDFLKQVVDGINWVLQVFNPCLPLVNEENIQFDKETANAAIVKFSNAYTSKDDEKIAYSLAEDILPLLEKISEVSGKIIK